MDTYSFFYRNVENIEILNIVGNSRFHDGLIWLQFDTIATKFGTFGV